jgi:hypothetical protein
MNVFFNGRLIVVESNIEWALPYWIGRKHLNDSITWTFKKTVI